MNEPSAAVLRRSSASKAKPDQDKLDKLQEAASEVRDLEATLKDLIERQKEIEAKVFTLYHETLPTLMDLAGVDRIGLPASGNLPAMDAYLCPFYRASIAASWPEEQRKAAFNFLESKGHGDLIKTAVSIAFPREERKQAVELAETLAEQGLAPQVNEMVHHGTLTSWLKEQIEERNQSFTQSELEALGASVGRIVNLKERKT